MPASGSLWTSAASLARLHNQTVNIYSHLIGAVVFIAYPLQLYRDSQDTSRCVEWEDFLVVSVYCYCVAICLTLSSMFHLLCDHRKSVSQFCNRLDYVGILVLMWGANVPTIYYGFIRDYKLRLTYWVTISLSAFGCCLLTFYTSFEYSELRRWRTTFYLAFGLSSIFYISHGIILHGLETQTARMSLSWMSWMAASNLAGAAIYAARVPERWVRFSYDIWGSSHQIFHVLVVFAALLHLSGLAQARDTVRTTADIVC